MSGTLSPDGEWLWDGAEWIPAPPKLKPNAVEHAQPMIDEVAESNNIESQDLTGAASNFDMNNDGELSEYEIQLAANSIVSPATQPRPSEPAVYTPTPNPYAAPQGNFGTNYMAPPHKHGKKTSRAPLFVALTFTLLILGGTSFWMFSPDYSPFDSIHDEDGDGYADSDDAFKFNPTQWSDSDGDGYGDNQGDTATQVDNFTMNPTQWKDSDGDGYGDNKSLGATQIDNFTTNPTQWKDTDGDGYGDNQSAGATQSDVFINDDSEWANSDSDQYGDNDDSCDTKTGDSYKDVKGCPDTDGDGYSNEGDAFPSDNSEWFDADEDGFGDNSDDCLFTFGSSTVDRIGCIDSDDDGYSNSGDTFPYDGNEWEDTDEDGYGDNGDACIYDFGDSYIDRLGCPDSDYDGYSNYGDEFPYDSSEWYDSDSDGYGNNEDLDPYGNAYLMFDVIYLTADSGQSYDTFDGPDMFMRVKIDANCDESYELTYDTSTVSNDYTVTSSNNLYININVADNENQFCFAIHIYDADLSSDDELDYVSGSGDSYRFTRFLHEDFDTNLIYSSSDTKSVNININVYVY